MHNAYRVEQESLLAYHTSREGPTITLVLDSGLVLGGHLSHLKLRNAVSEYSGRSIALILQGSSC